MGKLGGLLKKTFFAQSFALFQMFSDSEEKTFDFS